MIFTFHNLESYMGLRQAITLTGFLSLLFYFLLPTLLNAELRIKQYPLNDDYFDKTYVIRQGKSTKYLHAYCKQANALSLSITSQLDFEEQPVFPIYPKGHEAPKMQHKIYTFLQACNVRIQVSTENSNNDLVKIIRKTDNTTIFTLQKATKFTNDHTQIETKDVSLKWGMGQRFQKNFKITDGIWTIWNRDRPFQIDHGKPGRSGQTYGHQPVYLARQNSGQYHLVYFKNTHAFNLESKSNTSSLKYFSTGGNIHFVIFVGDKNPQNLLKKYHNYIGPANIPPFWSLGYHQSRWGYKSLNQFTEIIQNFKQSRIPIDTMWSDLDYMKNKAIFTVDQNNYPPEKMRKVLQDNNLHYIPLIDVGISLEDRVAISEGKQKDVFLKSIHHSGKDYEAVVWPGKVHFVDYLHPKASEFWQSQLQRLYRLIPFSGIWLDMNEPSNFQGNEPATQNYRIQHSQSKNMMTIDVNLEHHPTSSYQALKHDQVHAYYGHLSVLPTYQFLKKHGKPFIVSRSNSVGTGAYAAHWTGDNNAEWDFLRLSIGGNFLFQIFGIQMVGADICGFHKNTNQELCSRWMQLGSFYPFSRSHNENESISHQPWTFGDRLLQTSKVSLQQRYSLLKQMYTTLVNLNGTGSFFRPIIFEFYDDSLAFEDEKVQTQFMIGNYLMATPIVEQGQTSRKVYFPGESQIWYELHYETQNEFNYPKNLRKFRGRETKNIENVLPSPLPLFLRGGKLILTNKHETRTSLLNNKFTIIAGMKDGKAEGELLVAESYSTDSEIEECEKLGCNMLIKLTQKGDEQYLLQWNYVGHASFKGIVEIEKVRISDLDNDYVSKSSSVKIDKPFGQQKINVSHL